MGSLNDKLIISDLSKGYKEKEVLKSVSFTVKDGEFLSILGPSGCGKTTLLRILIGLLHPDTGTVVKDGVDITNAAPDKRGMGIVFQNYALFENMNVVKNVEYALMIKKETRPTAHEKALQMMKYSIEQVGYTSENTYYLGFIYHVMEQNTLAAYFYKYCMLTFPDGEAYLSAEVNLKTLLENNPDLEMPKVVAGEQGSGKKEWTFLTDAAEDKKE